MLAPSESPPSSYLQYLPPLVRAEESDLTRLLDRFLRIFEAILTGRPDAPPLRSLRDGRFRVDPPYEEHIDRLPELFDPWQSPDEFLPFLAARLGLPLEKGWDDHRKRRLIEGAVAIYQQRWLKRGLYTFFDLYASTGSRPRVVIDDGESLFAGRWVSEPGAEAIDLHPIAFARPGKSKTREHLGAALTHPTALVVNKTAREILVADSGPLDLPPVDNKPQRRAALWRLSPEGNFLDWNPDSPRGPLAFDRRSDTRPPPPPQGQPAPLELQDPIAVVADTDGSYLVLDRVDPQIKGRAVLYRFKAGAARQTVLTADRLGAHWPMDMVRGSGGRLFVLDQGKTDPGPQLLVIDLAVTPPVSRINLAPTVTFPTTLLAEQAGTVLVVDAGRQFLKDNENFPYPPELRKQLMGNLVRVTLGTPPQLQPLLTEANQPNPPLIFPNALLPREPGKDDSVLVCDLGVKLGQGKDKTTLLSEPLIRVMVEPARLFRVDLKPTVGVTPVQLKLPLVKPERLAWEGSRLLVLDKGFFQDLSETALPAKWRTRPHRFGVEVLFSATRPTDLSERAEVFRTLARVLDQERPAHTLWEFQFAYGASTPSELESVPPNSDPARPADNPDPVAPRTRRVRKWHRRRIAN